MNENSIGQSVLRCVTDRCVTCSGCFDERGGGRWIANNKDDDDLLGRVIRADDAHAKCANAEEGDESVDDRVECSRHRLPGVSSFSSDLCVRERVIRDRHRVR